MTVVNDLIRRAREQPSELTINDNQVGTLADHARALMFTAPFSNTDLEDMIRKGKMCFLGIPIRVLGVPNAQTPPSPTTRTPT